ncbi:hypothetical protein NPIL_612521, partial [Nephila pilipes]
PEARGYHLSCSEAPPHRRTSRDL